MALIPGQVFGDMSGKLGGSVFSRNKAGKIVRAYVVPTDARSGAQISNRSRFSGAVSQWNTLTDAEKAAWNQFAVSNFSGKKRTISGLYSGYQAFSSCNLQLATANRSLIVPTMSTPAATITVASPPTFNLTAPVVAFNSSIQSSTGAALAQTLTAATFDTATSVLTATFELPSAQAAAPVWANPSTNLNVNLQLCFSNILRAGANAVSNLIAYTIASCGKITVSSGWTSSASYVLEFDVDPTYLGSLKLAFQTGSRFYVTAFAFSDSGATSRIGSVLVTAT